MQTAPLQDQNKCSYTVPRETYVALEEFFGDKKIAETYTKALEAGIRIVEKTSREMIEDKLEQHKILLKEELTKELVTRELFELRMGEMLRIIEGTEARLLEKIEAGDAGLHKDMEVKENSLRKEMKAIEESLRKDMKAIEESLRKDMKAMEDSIRKDMKAMFDKLNFKFNLLVGLVVLALTLANPAFNKLLEKLFF